MAISNKSNQHQNDVSNNPLTAISYMPPPSNLSRPIIALKNVRNYIYRIKKIEIFEAENGKQLHPKNINYLIIYPIESKYWILFSDRFDEDGLPLPLQDLKEVNKVTTSKAIIPIKQISFIPKKGSSL